jgi:hypothetical protein
LKIICEVANLAPRKDILSIEGGARSPPTLGRCKQTRQTIGLNLAGGTPHNLWGIEIHQRLPAVIKAHKIHAINFYFSQPPELRILVASSSPYTPQWRQEGHRVAGEEATVVGAVVVSPVLLFYRDRISQLGKSNIHSLARGGYAPRDFGPPQTVYGPFFPLNASAFEPVAMSGLANTDQRWGDFCTRRRASSCVRVPIPRYPTSTRLYTWRTRLESSSEWKIVAYADKRFADIDRESRRGFGSHQPSVFQRQAIRGHPGHLLQGRGQVLHRGRQASTARKVLAEAQASARLSGQSQARRSRRG